MVWPAAWVQMKPGVPPVRWDAAAIGDAFQIVNPTHENGDWGPGFLFWHSSYFTVCVWLVLFLMRAPRRARNIGISTQFSTTPLRVPPAPDCTFSAVAHPALEEAVPGGVWTGLMGGELEVLRVPRRVNAKSFARFRALPNLRTGFRRFSAAEGGAGV